MTRSIFHTLSTILAMLVCSASAAEATPVVRILFYTGDVAVTTGGTTDKARIGQTVTANDRIVLRGNATLQLSIDGKVVKYSKPMTLKVSDAIKRAGSGENAVVANTLRTIAGASGADRSSRSSVAGATRADDSSTFVAQAETRVRTTAGQTISDEITRRTGIENPGEVLEEASMMLKGEDVVVLEPRSTAVVSGPITFRWMRHPEMRRTTVTVRDYLGEEVYSTSTTDTFAVWQSPTLLPEAIYSWSLDDPDNPLRSANASFHQLSDDTSITLRHGEEAIRNELGNDNPALPLLLGAYYSDHGCYGLAARLYTTGALVSAEHFHDYMERACEEYRYNIFMPEKEVVRIYHR